MEKAEHPSLHSPGGSVGLTTPWSPLSVTTPAKPRRRHLRLSLITIAPVITQSSRNFLFQLQLVHLRLDIVDVKLCHAGIGAREADYTLFIHNEHGAISRATLVVVNPIQFRYFTFRMEVRQYRIRNITERRGERRLGRPGVVAYTQYLGILPLEVRIGYSERGDLVRSASGERKYVKR